MSSLFIAIIIGIVAGIIDATPMILMKLDKVSIISAFFHYLVLGIIIPFVNWGISSWLTGIIISVLSAIPIIIIVFPKDKKALIPIFIFSIILGAGIGIGGELFIS